MLDGLSLPDLWRHAVYHHRMLKAFARQHAGSWSPGIRRTAWMGLAVLTSMIRRLIHLMAMEVVLVPLRPRDTDNPLPPLPPESRRRRLRFRLTEIAPERYRSGPNPDSVPDAQALNHDFFLDRLAHLADVYRARARLARRLARRVQPGRAPLRILPLPKRLSLRARPEFLSMLQSLDARLAAPNSS